MLWFFWTLPVLLQCWCFSLLVCVQTLTPRENRERPESGIFLNLRKKTQYLMNTLYVLLIACPLISASSYKNILLKRYFWTLGGGGEASEHCEAIHHVHRRTNGGGKGGASPPWASQGGEVPPPEVLVQSRHREISATLENRKKIVLALFVRFTPSGRNIHPQSINIHKKSFKCNSL